MVFGFEADMNHWSVLMSKAKDGHGVCISDTTIAILLFALVAAIGYFVFGDAVVGFLKRF